MHEHVIFPCSIPIGTICQVSKSFKISDDWNICDGQNGTMDLRETDNDKVIHIVKVK
jgi:hypothetical protein